MKINSNIQAQIANSVLKMNEGKYSASTERMSSGYKINHASDSPSGMAISNKMRAQINSLNKAKDNTSNAINVVQTADGALQEVHDMLQRMNELAIKAANGTNSSSDRIAIQEEVTALKKEIDRVASDTEYNTQNLLGGEQGMKGYTNNEKVKVIGYNVDFPMGDYSLEVAADDTLTFKKLVDDGMGGTTKEDVPNVKSIEREYERDDDGNILGARVTVTLMDGSDMLIDYSGQTVSDTTIDVTGIGGMKVQVGSSSGQEIQLVIPNMDTKSMGIDEIDMRTMEDAEDAIDKIGKALEYVSKSRSQIGAYQNRFEHTVTSLDENIENLTAAYSTIKDVDMADEMVDYTKLQVLVQAGTSMLTQANEQPQQALQLLQ